MHAQRKCETLRAGTLTGLMYVQYVDVLVKIRSYSLLYTEHGLSSRPTLVQAFNMHHLADFVSFWEISQKVLGAE
jgi:hypothetical protein